MKTLQQRLTVGLEADGTVEGYEVVTRLAEIPMLRSPQQYGFAVDHEDRFIEFVVDNGPEDLLVRLPFELVKEFAARAAGVED